MMEAYEKALNGAVTDMSADNPPATWTAEQAHKDLEEARNRNQADLNDLARQGYPMDTLSLLKIRVDYITEVLMGGRSERDLMEFGAGWERHLGSILEQAAQQVRLATLANPGIIQVPGQTSITDVLGG